MHQKNDEKTIPTEHGSDISRKILEREQDFNMKMLQVKGFWRQKRTVSENQLFRLENRNQVATFFYRSMFQSLTIPAGNQIQADSKSIETAFEVISSYLSTYHF